MLRGWRSLKRSTTRAKHELTLGLYPASEFAIQLERERSRTDRSGNPFCVTLYRLTNRGPREREVHSLCRVLKRRQRITDLVGWFDDEHIGVILPETGAPGAWKVANEVLESVPSSPQCRIYTYPPQLPIPEMSHSQRSRKKEGAAEEQAFAEDSVLRKDSTGPMVRNLDGLLIRPLPRVNRLLDVLLATLAITLLLPFGAVVALTIKLTSRGPVFFKQTRVGLNGKCFPLYKFRTMVADAEQQQPELLGMNEKDGPIFKIANDPRITRIGKWLRKFSIDELPQFWNLLRGDMTLVGPRPPIPKEVPEYEGWQRRRLERTPGLTCIWQVSGRSTTSFEEWMRMDVRYVRSQNPWLDLKLLLRTIPAVLLGRGAH